MVSKFPLELEQIKINQLKSIKNQFQEVMKKKYGVEQKKMPSKKKKLIAQGTEMRQKAESLTTAVASRLKMRETHRDLLKAALSTKEHQVCRLALGAGVTLLLDLVRVNHLLVAIHTVFDLSDTGHLLKIF